MQAIVGHRDGFVSSVSLDSDSRPAVTETHARGPGETVSIRRIADRYICANLGDGYSEGGMVSIAGSSRLQYAGCSVFAASGPPACGPPRTAVGLTNRASVAVIDNARIAEVFNAHTKTDILSTTFAMSSCHVFLGGGRDGRARLFDTRVSSKQHDCRRGLLSAPLTSKSSIHGIGAHGWRLAAASMDSRVRMWDIRFAGTEWGDESSSAQSKSYSTDDCFGDLHRPLEMLSATRLGFAVCRDLVAAAGGENQIRIWSMNTGGIVRTVALPPSATGCSAIDLALTSAGMPLLLYSQLGTVVCLRAPLAR
ncbi:hypothetical protein EV174_002365 [Coemansia sp. RSA 2320]|nr:hypothetical protein EV174_002365 [Coemansia sp. RSA 2320]